MRSKKTTNRLTKLALWAVVVCAFAGCIKDDLTHCKPKFSVVNIDLTDYQDVKSVVMYVFDQNGVLIGKTFPKPGERIELAYPGYDQLTLVSWGNAETGNMNFKDIEIGEKIEFPFFQLHRTGQMQGVQNSKADALPIVESPGDVFYGTVNVVRAEESVASELTLTRQTSKVSFVSHGMIPYFGAQGAGDFTINTNRTKDKLNFRGEDYGDDVAYSHLGSVVSDGAYVVEPYNILKTNQALVVQIYCKGKLVYTIDKDSAGKQLFVQPGEQLNVEVTFTMGVGVAQVAVTAAKWGAVYEGNFEYK